MRSAIRSAEEEMNISRSIRAVVPGFVRVVFVALLFVVFFQLLAEFVETVYAFGLMGTGIPPEIACVALLLSPVMLLIFRRGLPRIALIALTALVFVARVAESLGDTRMRMLLSGVGLALFLILLPELVRTSFATRSGREWGAGLGLALLLSILLRALGSGSDISLVRPFLWVGWLLAILGAVCLALLRRGDEPQPATRPGGTPLGFGRTLVMALGLMGTLVLIYFAFTSPTVIARWTEGAYPAIVAVLGLSIASYMALRMLRPQALEGLGRGWLLALNAFFLAALIGTIALHQVSFPKVPSGFPLEVSPAGLPGDLLLYLMLVLSPVLILDAERFAMSLAWRTPSARTSGLAWLIASLFLLVMIFIQVFTTVYDYFPIVGPLFRDRFWLVFLIGGLACALPVLALRAGESGPSPDSANVPLASLVSAKALAVAALAVLAVGWLGAAPVAPANPRTDVRVMTYNIQQVYDANGQRDFAGQLQVIREVQPDILGLEECDTARIAGGNSDVVRAMADALDMYSYYGPTTVTGTFGIALLSRYPIENPITFFMYSEGEQTAAILAEITISGQRFTVLVTHLGNGGPIVQQQQVLQRLSGRSRILAMGDFNFRPDTEQYRITAAVLEDSWLTKWGPGGNPSQFDPADRIDQIFVSPGTTIRDSRYIDSPASDHPAMVTVVGW
jgi:endonuclease/exonuclease/phosphatase family metal-dependent hydrolase